MPYTDPDPVSGLADTLTAQLVHVVAFDHPVRVRLAVDNTRDGLLADLDASQARDLAAVLLDGADTIEGLQSGTRPPEIPHGLGSNRFGRGVPVYSDDVDAANDRLDLADGEVFGAQRSGDLVALAVALRSRAVAWRAWGEFQPGGSTYRDGARLAADRDEVDARGLGGWSR